MKLYRDEHSLFMVFAICSAFIFGVAIAVGYIGDMCAAGILFFHEDKGPGSFIGPTLIWRALDIWILGAFLVLPTLLLSIRIFLKKSHRKWMVLSFLSLLILAVISFVLVGRLYVHAV